MASAAFFIDDTVSYAGSSLHRYLPLMKTKAGEVTAIDKLSGYAKARILPVFHVCEQLKPAFASALATVWLGRCAGIDGAHNSAHLGTTQTFVALVNELRARGVAALPCWHVNDPLPYRQSAISLFNDHGGIVKVAVSQVSEAATRITALGLPLSLVDLVIDLKHVGGISDPDSFGSYAASMLTQQYASLAAFRSITVAAAVAPKDNSALVLGVNRLPRIDWQLWCTMSRLVSFKLDYADYLTSHPDLTEPPGVAMANATVTARYTSDHYLIIVKGRSINGQHGLPMGDQYRSHANVIANDPEFEGVDDVWADQEIRRAASGAKGLGSRGKWSGFAANRHISLITGRLP